MSVISATHNPSPKTMTPMTKTGAALLMLLPVLALSIVFEYWPAFRSIQLMFYDWNLVSSERNFVGLDNFRTILNDDRFHTAIKNTVVYAAILAPLQIFVPLGMALVLRPLAKSKLSIVYRSLLFLPMVISLPVAAVVWLWMLNPMNGVLNEFMTSLGFERVYWLSEPRTAMGSVIAVAAWSSIGFNILLYLTALDGIPSDVRDAARLDGSGEWALFKNIEWALISPTFFFVVLTTILFVNNEIFGVINILTNGGPYNSTTNVLYYLYQRGFKFFQAGEASALAITLVGFFFLVTRIQFRVGERKVHYGN